jgi:peptide/nickel transport system substrate-binding protein
MTEQAPSVLHCSPFEGDTSMKHHQTDFGAVLAPVECERIFHAVLGRDVTRRDALRMMGAAGVAAAGAGFLGAPGAARAQTQAAVTPKRGGRIRASAHSTSTADTLDPSKGATAIDYVRHNMFYSGLTELDGRLVPHPALAEEITHTGAKVWRFKLRRGVTFHDGKPLTSADVVYSLLRHKDAALGSKVRTVALQFTDVKAVGPDEVEVTLEVPNADLPVILAASHFLIVQDGAATFTTANGTGPYQCKEFRPGVRSVGVRNNNFWKLGKPYVDEIEIIGIPDEAARVNALLSGDIQIMNNMNPRSVSRVNGSGKAVALETKSSLYSDLIVRQDTTPAGSQDFTLAIKYLLDREQVRDAVYRGFAMIGNDQPIQPGHRYHLEGLPQRAFDPDKAKFHLQKAGLVGATMPIVVSPAAEGSTEVAVLLQQAAQKIGLNLTVNRVPADGFWSNHWMKHPLGFGSVNPRASADLIFTQFFKSDAAWNESQWKNDQFDQLLLLARAEADEAKRKQLYGDMQQIVSEKCGICIPTFISYVDGFDKRVKGFESVPLGGLMGYAFAEHVWLDA